VDQKRGRIVRVALAARILLGRYLLRPVEVREAVPWAL
jgi:hypothetical protein